jgi:hypothetical protein
MYLASCMHASQKVLSTPQGGDDKITSFLPVSIHITIQALIREELTTSQLRGHKLNSMSRALIGFVTRVVVR